MKKQSPVSLAAKNIKKELKEKYPSIVFSVVSKMYSGGNHVRVVWTGGPKAEEVETLLNKYVCGEFNAMTDTYDYARFGRAFRDQQGACKHLFCERKEP